jgi:acyl-CoA reductase-like NAD-dependent aldehyde dehydrogenase
VSPLTEEQVNLIAIRVAGALGSPVEQHAHLPTNVSKAEETIRAGQGVFANLDAAVKAAQEAHLKLMSMKLEQRDNIVASIRTTMLEHASDLAKMAHEETGLGRYDDKVLKNKLVSEKTPGTEVLNPTAYTGDRGLTLLELAPYGVIGSITPVTNPTSTIICNTIGMVAAGNAVVFNVHPSAKEVSIFNIKLINQAITKAGGPPNLVVTLSDPTIESAQKLMTHPGIRLLVVTGGAAVVKAAMTSGKRAICAGPGNPPVVVDETADIESAAKSIVRGASMDNNIICTDEKEVFVLESVADNLLSAFKRCDAIVLTPQQITQLEGIIFAENRGPRKHAVMEKTLIGKNVQVILEKIGLQVENRIRLAVAPVSLDHPLVWSEQMMPVLPVVRMPNADAAIDTAKEVEHGFRHTAIMHSKNLDNLSRMAKVMNCSIFVKNGPSLAGLGYGGEGYTSFTIASPTGEGLTNPRSFSRERRCVLVDHFRIV